MKCNCLTREKNITGLSFFGGDARNVWVVRCAVGISVTSAFFWLSVISLFAKTLRKNKKTAEHRTPNFHTRITNVHRIPHIQVSI